MSKVEWNLGAKLKNEGKKYFANENYLETIKCFEEYIDKYNLEIRNRFRKHKEVIDSLILSQYYLKINNSQNLNINLDNEKELVFTKHCYEYINDYFLDLKNYLKDKRDIINKLMISYYHLIKKGIYKREKIKKFEEYREEFFEIAKWFNNKDILKEWSGARLENLFRYNIEIIIKKMTEEKSESIIKMEEDFKSELRIIFGRFISVFCPVFAEELFIKQLLTKINHERSNFNRKRWTTYQNIKNTIWLIEFFLAITENSGVYSEIRASMMNLMADLVYFYGENQGDRGKKEEEAINWLEKSLNEFSNNHFTKNRIKELKRNMTTIEQINKFRHDTTNKIAYIKENLNKILSQNLSASELRVEVEKLGDKVKEIESFFRLIKKERANFGLCDIEELLEELLLDFTELSRENLIFQGESIPVEIDKDYFMIIISNLVENSLEAYRRREIKSEEQLITIKFNYERMECMIRDQAGGIPKEFQQDNRLFEPYISSKGTCQDAGLGLAQVKMAVELQEAEIDYKTDEKGTEFIIKLAQDEF